MNRTKANLALTKTNEKKRLFLLKYEETEWELIQGILYKRESFFFLWSLNKTKGKLALTIWDEKMFPYQNWLKLKRK